MKAATIIERNVVRCIRPCGWPPCSEKLEPPLGGDFHAGRHRYCSEHHRVLANKRRRTLRAALATIERELGGQRHSLPRPTLAAWRIQVTWELDQYT